MTNEEKVLESLDRQREAAGPKVRFFGEVSIASDTGLVRVQVVGACKRLAKKGIIVRWHQMAGRTEWM